MGIVKSNPYGQFKYNQCVQQDWDFQNQILREEKYNSSFGSDCHDIFQSIYQKDVQFSGDGPVKQMLESIMNTSDFKDMKDRTKGNHFISYIHMKEMIPELQKIQKELKNNKKPLDQKQKDAIRQAMRSAVKRAEEKGEKTEEIIDILGIGKEGGIQSDQEVKDAIEVSKRIVNDESFMKIMEMAGRMQRMADTTIKTNVDYGLEELIGIDCSDDVENVLPEETVDDELFALKYAENRLQVNKFRGKQAQDSGPIIVCIDESGSMMGFPYHFSRAILFGMYVVAVQQNRPFFVNRFSHIVESVQINTPSDILQFIGKFMNGGTDFNKALNASFNQIDSDSEFKKADIIFITDGCDYIDEETAKRLKEQKEKLSLKIISLLIGYHPETIKTFSDKIFSCTDEASAESFCQEVFSL